MGFNPFVYGLVDPIEPKHVRYVGMAPVVRRRPTLHAREARRQSAHITHKINWIRKIQSEGREPSVLILEQLSSGTSREFVGFVEQCYIKSLREIGHRLTNSTDGDEGQNNPTPETREKMRASMLGNKFSLGRVQPEEERTRRGKSIAAYYANHPGEKSCYKGSS